MAKKNTKNAARKPDLEKFGAAANDTSSRAAGLWLSFLTFTAYLTLTVGSVTHVMLFRESPIKLPVLNIDLPLVAFFWIAPILFVLFHFYLLLQVSITVRKVSIFSKLLEDSSLPEEERERLRSSLNNFLVVQFLFGDNEERQGFTSMLLRFIVIVTLVFAPVVILLQFQLIFLPYHSAWTYLHRILVFVDLALIWTFWFSIRYSHGRIGLPSPNQYSSGAIGNRIAFLLRKRTVATVCSAAVLVFSFVIFAYPGEFISPRISDLCGDRAISSCFLGGKINMVRGTPETIFSNVLVLPNRDLVDESSTGQGGKESEKRVARLSLRGRNLIGAVLIRSDLRGADFTGANLNGARLDYANLTRAEFSCAFPPGSPVRNSQWPYDECTSLQGTSFYRAHLEEANFEGAKMQGAFLMTAILYGANLTNAQLQMAVFSSAQLQGARLNNAVLHGASFDDANLIGAVLDNAELQGADLTNAQLQLASLENTVLDGAGIESARDTQNSSRCGETTRYEQKPINGLASPNLMFATLSGNNMKCPFNDLSHWEQVRKEVVAQMPKEYGGCRFVSKDAIKLSPIESSNWTEMRDSAAKGELGWKNNLIMNLSDSPNLERYKSMAAIADFLVVMMCAPGSNPYITRALIGNSRVLVARPELGKVWYMLKDTKLCEGAGSLQLTDYQLLMHVVETQVPPVPDHLCADAPTTTATSPSVSLPRIAQKRDSK